MNTLLQRYLSQGAALFTRWALLLLMLFCLLLPLKLSLAYICGIPFLLLWICWQSVPGTVRPWEQLELRVRYFPLLLFFGYVVVSGLFGLDPLETIREISSLAFFSLLIPAIVTSVEAPKASMMLLLLITGQSIASLHSILESSSQGILKRLFIGAVSESGQLSLTLIVTVGLLLRYLVGSVEVGERHPSNDKEYGYSWIIGALFFAAFLLLGFPKVIGFASSTSLVLAVLVVGVFSVNAFSLLKKEKFRQASLAFLLQCALPACCAALIVNLKRGPWLGVVCALILLLSRSFRKCAPLLLAFIVLLVLTISPIYQRLFQSFRDFQISGGREIIWQIGAELSFQYPLGIGYANSPILQAFSAEIPEQLKHFHSNALNILVETGWIGLFLFGWWIIRNLGNVFSTRKLSSENCLLVSLGAAILSWQIAGIVEYNFGDSEVAYLAFILIGIHIKLSEAYQVSLDTSHTSLKAAA